MIRYAMQKLEKWKNGPDHKPLIIRGARQVGKTWLMKEFGRNSYERVAYISFDNNRRMETLFNSDYNIARIIVGLQIESGVTIEAANTLIIAEENLQAKSLRIYYQKYAPKQAVRISMSDYRKENWLTNIPLYAIGLLPEIL